VKAAWLINGRKGIARQFVIHFPFLSEGDSTVGTVTGLGNGQPQSRVSIPNRSKRHFTDTSDRLQSPRTFLIGGYRGSFSGVKRTGREADHSPPYGARVKK